MRQQARIDLRDRRKIRHPQRQIEQVHGQVHADLHGAAEIEHEHVLQVDPEPDDKGRNRGVRAFLDQVLKLTKAQSLAGTRSAAMEVIPRRRSSSASDLPD